MFCSKALCLSVHGIAKCGGVSIRPRRYLSTCRLALLCSRTACPRILITLSLCLTSGSTVERGNLYPLSYISLAVMTVYVHSSYFLMLEHPFSNLFSCLFCDLSLIPNCAITSFLCFRRVYTALTCSKCLTVIQHISLLCHSIYETYVLVDSLLPFALCHHGLGVSSSWSWFLNTLAPSLVASNGQHSHNRPSSTHT